MDTKRTMRNFNSSFQIGVITMCVALEAAAGGETRAVDHYESRKAVIEGKNLYLMSDDRQKLATAPLMEQGQAAVLKLPISAKENVPGCWDIMGETLYITRVHALGLGPLINSSICVDRLLAIPIKELENWAAMAKRVKEMKAKNLVIPPNIEVDELVSGKLETQYSAAKALPIMIARSALAFGGISVSEVQDQPVCWTDMHVGTNRIITIVAETKIRRNAIRVMTLDISSDEIKNWIDSAPSVIGPPMHGFVITGTTDGAQKIGRVTLVSEDGSVCLFADDTLTSTDERIGAEFKAKEAEDNRAQIILVVDKRKKAAECFRFLVRDGAIKLLGKSEDAGNDAEIANALKKAVAVLQSR